MLPEEKGRFCGSCSKIVVDFSTFSRDEIVDYLRARSADRVCGRFRTSQVQLPAILPLQQTNTGKWRLQRFAAALLMAFGGMLFSGCGKSDEHRAGKVMTNLQPIQLPTQNKKPDTLQPSIPQPKIQAPMPIIDLDRVIVQGEIELPYEREEHTMGVPLDLPVVDVVHPQKEERTMGVIAYVPNEQPKKPNFRERINKLFQRK